MLHSSIDYSIPVYMFPHFIVFVSLNAMLLCTAMHAVFSADNISTNLADTPIVGIEC